jgi:tripartite ATP-independent transporter DctM subunit
MDILTITAILFGCLFIVLATGLPVSFALGGVGVVFTFILWGSNAVGVIAFAAYDLMSSPILLAAPLFMLMGIILQESGIADDVYEMFYRWMGPVRGGLAIGTIIICTIFAAIIGVSGASTITMGLIALPSMLKRNYDKNIVLGSVAAGGILGILIPPSVIMIIYAMISGESVGDLFAAGVVPGLMLASLYIIYIAVRSYFQPHLGPALPKEGRATLREKLVSLKAVVLPLFLIFLVLGTIYLGICTPTEAAAIGALGAIVCAAIRKNLNLDLVKTACRQTFRLVGMALWVLLGAAMFNSLYRAVGAQSLIINLVGELGMTPWTVLILMQVSLFILGMLMDDFAVVMLCVPIYVPIIKALGFNPLWFAMLFMVQIQMAYLTPPYGFNLFYMKSIVPSGITMGDLYKSVIPFVCLQLIGLILVMLFPQIVLWLLTLLR